MTNTNMDYEKYLVRKPVYEAFPGIQNRQSPSMTLLSNALVPGANNYLELGWITDIPKPNPHIFEHVHAYDEIIILWGNDHETPQELGAEIEFYVGGQIMTSNTTTGIFIPRGISHGPLIWKKFSRPHIQMSLMLGAGSFSEAWGKSGFNEPQKSPPRKTTKFDYQQYVIRSPIREAGAEFVKGRTAPTMTYMSGNHIPGVKYYIEMGWTFDMPATKRPVLGTQMPSMAHTKYEEIVLHIGGDPDNPEDLGGDVEFWIGGQPLQFNTSSAIFVPKGLLHGPIKCLEYRKPHIVMAIMLGAGTVKEGWEGSFNEK
jgi:hypothetical protein